jgi:Membrane domain of glycerophosphoryl diester phosphodiesterase
MITSILKHAWDLYRKHFGIIAAVIVVIWLPLNLFSSYMDYFVFDPDDIRKSFKLSQFLENFIGIIATAGIISIGHMSQIGQHPTFGGAMSYGADSWGRMWWTRFLTGLVIILGLLLLVIPGIYLSVRLALVESVAVCERVSGSAAMRRSFELTKGRFWDILLLGLVFGAIMCAAVICVILPIIFIPALDHWLVDAASSLFVDFVAAFGTLCVFYTYISLSSGQNIPNESP